MSVEPKPLVGAGIEMTFGENVVGEVPARIRTDSPVYTPK